MERIDVPCAAGRTTSATVLPTAGDARRPCRAHTNLTHRGGHREPHAQTGRCAHACGLVRRVGTARARRALPGRRDGIDGCIESGDGIAADTCPKGRFKLGHVPDQARSRAVITPAFTDFAHPHACREDGCSPGSAGLRARLRKKRHLKTGSDDGPDGLMHPRNAGRTQSRPDWRRVPAFACNAGCGANVPPRRLPGGGAGAAPSLDAKFQVLPRAVIAPRPCRGSFFFDAGTRAGGGAGIARRAS